MRVCGGGGCSDKSVRILFDHAQDARNAVPCTVGSGVQYFVKVIVAKSPRKSLLYDPVSAKQMVQYRDENDCE